MFKFTSELDIFFALRSKSLTTTSITTARSVSRYSLAHFRFLDGGEDGGGITVRLFGKKDIVVASFVSLSMLQTSAVTTRHTMSTTLESSLVLLFFAKGI